MALSETLKSQFDHSWKMLRDGIDKCDESNWKKVVDDPFFVPARVAFHVIQTVDYYVGKRASDFDWQAFGFDWEEAPAEKLPGKQDLLDYLANVEKKTDVVISQASEEFFFGSDEEFGGHTNHPIDRFLYAVRHSHHHIGQLSLDLQRRRLPEITW